MSGHSALTTLGSFALINLMLASQAQASPVDWSGAYLGFGIGVAQGTAKAEVQTQDGFPGTYFTPPDPEQINAVTATTLTGRGLSGALFAGYGQQRDNLYFGLEASASSLDFDASDTSGAVYLSNATGAFRNRMSVSADWQATLRGRLGWAEERWLTYVTGGVAFTQVRLDAQFRDNFLGVGATGSGSEKQTRTGWVVGAGGEYALSDAWRLRGEYLYADYGRIEASAVVTNPAFPLFANEMDSSVDFRTQSLTLGLSYQF